MRKSSPLTIKRTFAGSIRLATLSIVIFAGITNQNVLAFQPQVGEPLTEFTLPRIDNGQPVSLSDYRGRKLLLIMFASW